MKRLFDSSLARYLPVDLQVGTSKAVRFLAFHEVNLTRVVSKASSSLLDPGRLYD
jgi:hypothetical protein